MLFQQQVFLKGRIMVLQISGFQLKVQIYGNFKIYLSIAPDTRDYDLIVLELCQQYFQICWCFTWQINI